MWIHPGSARDLIRASEQERERSRRSNRVRRAETGSRKHPIT
jgi:hypothetical protein